MTEVDSFEVFMAQVINDECIKNDKNSSRMKM